MIQEQIDNIEGCKKEHYSGDVTQHPAKLKENFNLGCQCGEEKDDSLKISTGN